ncbi:hypothetical protein [Aminipila luticellarii]|uniref:Uncharacterized protein n=1 Tax=Aminipila luticellarii TaxID=2507160 RepID=A0A410PTR0_9FIRM|nr:hypothetical protein [Aminipila luticellarii]QAT42258.1 hypothetical protein EQM06_02870 [Aminipila luticellarii]
MRKRVVLLLAILLIFALFFISKSNLVGPGIDAPVFVKSLIYSEDMDVNLNYIAPRGFDKSVEKVQIQNAPKGIDCVVYGEEKEPKGKYTIGTVNIGVNCDYWSDETGIGQDLKINEILVTWSDGSQTTESIGRITVAGRNMQDNSYMNITGHDGIKKATYTLTKDTEITGIAYPYKDEVLSLFSNITINQIPLGDISKSSSVKLKKNEQCILEYQVNDESESQYGNIRIRGFLMGNSSKSEEKIASFIWDKKFDFNEAGDYLKKQSL